MRPSVDPTICSRNTRNKQSTGSHAASRTGTQVPHLDNADAIRRVFHVCRAQRHLVADIVILERHRQQDDLHGRRDNQDELRDEGDKDAHTAGRMS